MLHADNDDEWTLVFVNNHWNSKPDERKKTFKHFLLNMSQAIVICFSLGKMLFSFKNNSDLNRKNKNKTCKLQKQRVWSQVIPIVI